MSNALNSIIIQEVLLEYQIMLNGNQNLEFVSVTCFRYSITITRLINTQYRIFADKEEELCKLHCRVGITKHYYPLARKVIDGTKCDFDSYNICVNGICRPGGCDNVLYSNTTLGRYS